MKTKKKKKPLKKAEKLDPMERALAVTYAIVWDQYCDRKDKPPKNNFNFIAKIARELGREKK